MHGSDRKVAPFALLALLILAGCTPPRGPAEVYRDYVQALVDGRIEAAYGMLSTRSRAALEARASDDQRRAGRAGLRVFRRALSAAGGAGVALLPLDAAEGVKEAVFESADRARILVETPRGPRRALMVRERERWKVELQANGAAAPGVSSRSD